MGMSASQARLLSITSRLTNNEFRAQTITNSKLRLAEKSEEASAEYMDALSSQSLVYGVYNDNGEYTTQKLTPALLYDYQPLKTQYALVNPSGKLMVSAQDAKNFEESDDLTSFLDKYGLLENVEYTQKVQKPNENYADEMEQYNTGRATYDAYIENKKQWDEYNSKYIQWETDHANWKIVHDAWNIIDSQEDLYSLFSGIVGTSDNPTAYCYKQALNGNAGCYLHLLNHIIDYNGSNIDWTDKSYQTSLDGVELVPNNTSLGAMGAASELIAVSNALNANDPNDLANPIRYCDGDDNFDVTREQNILQAAREEEREPTALEILKSDFIEIAKEDGTYDYQLKTLKQKAIDMYYIIENRSDLGVTSDDMIEMLKNFTDGDMKKLSPEEPQEPEEPLRPEEKLASVDCPLKPSEFIETYQNASQPVVNDKDKAQWYTNLWYMMNGSETVNKVQQDEIYDDEKNESYSVFIVNATEKSGKGGTYEVFEDMNLFKSSDWLQFALEHGMVTMVQAQYTNPSADSGKTPEMTSEGITWKSIIYTNASDIRAQEDEIKIALAEVKYKNAITEIENKDKKFDQDLKKLDTEHTALQTEYDSIKEVISKNVDRSFKAFS